MFWLRRFYDQYQSELASEDNSLYVFEFKYDGGLNCYKKYYPLLTRWIEGGWQRINSTNFIPLAKHITYKTFLSGGYDRVSQGEREMK